MIHDFTFDGISLFEFGAIVTNRPSWVVPQRDVNSVTVPGRSGDLIVDNGRYKNINVSYQISTIPGFMKSSLFDTANSIKDWLVTNGSYCRLTDTYNPNYYRLARVSNISDIVNDISSVGSATVTFDCKPYLYRNDGDALITATKADFTVINPEIYESEPYFKIYGSGDITVSIGDMSFTVSDIEDYIEVDCEMQDCFRGLQNCNRFFAGEFPRLLAGENVVKITGNFEKVQYKGRWRRI